MIRSRFLLILTVVFLTLLLIYWVGQYDDPETTAVSTARLFELAGTQISQIHIISPDDQVRGTRNDGGWSMEEPGLVPAASEKWEAMADSLSRMTYQRIISYEDTSAPEYGFSQPELIVTFEDPDNNVYKIEFGAKTPAGEFYYVRLGNDPRIFTMAASWREPFMVQREDLRQSRALPVNKDRILRISFHGPEAEFSFRFDGTSWELEKPWTAPGSNSRLRQLVTRLANLEIHSFLDSDYRRMGVYFPDVPTEIRIVQTDNKLYRLQLAPNFPGNSDPDIILGRQSPTGPYFTLAGETRSIMGTQWRDLLSPTLLNFDLTEIRGLTMDGAQGHQIFSRANSTMWRWRNAGGIREIEAGPLITFIRHLRDMPVVEYLPLPTDPSDGEPFTTPDSFILDIDEGGYLSLQLTKIDDEYAYLRNPLFQCLMKVESQRWSRLVFEPDDWLLDR